MRREPVAPIEVWSPQRAVRRVSKVDPTEVMGRHLMDGEGEPLVVTDAQEDWFNSRERWTLESLGRDYGDEEVVVNDKAPLQARRTVRGQLHAAQQEWDDPVMRSRVSTLREYAAYVR